MDLEDFNAMGESEAGAAIRPCVGIDSWVASVVAGRPYGAVADALDTAAAQARTWTGAEVENALADHPRIGERHPGSGASAAMSAREQVGVDPADAALEGRLADGNRRYEERFGRIYLVRAEGRTAAEMLDLLEERLTNDPATELDVTKEQLAEIATLRLKGLLS